MPSLMSFLLDDPLKVMATHAAIPRVAHDVLRISPDLQHFEACLATVAKAPEVAVRKPQDVAELVRERGWTDLLRTHVKAVLGTDMQRGCTSRKNGAIARKKLDVLVEVDRCAVCPSYRAVAAS